MMDHAWNSCPLSIGLHEDVLQRDLMLLHLCSAAKYIRTGNSRTGMDIRVRLRATRVAMTTYFDEAINEGRADLICLLVCCSAVALT